MLMLLCLVEIALTKFSMQPFQKYCPSKIQCDVEDSVGGSIGGSNGGSITNSNVSACCGSCSCDLNCGQTMTCCLEEDNVKYSQSKGKECVEPFVGSKDVVSSLEMRGLMMVTHCLDKNVQCKYMNGQINMWIVEDKNSEIFLNEECAKCNNVSEFTRWDIKMNLPTKSIGHDSFREFGAGTFISEGSSGAIVFLPTSTSSPIICDTHSFQSINYSSCPNELYKELCASVFLPYSHVPGISVYRNVFCYFCEHNEELKCSPPYVKSPSGSYSVILDHTISTDEVETYFSRNQVDTETCNGNFLPHPYKVLLYIIVSVI